MKHQRESNFPGKEVFRERLGVKSSIAARLIKRCGAENGYEDVLAICQPLVAQSTKAVNFGAPTPEQIGSVYLLKSGRYYKIGRTNAMGRREYELAIQLPDKVALIHEIKTDDPAGIEFYWHRRFKERQKNREWFALTPKDISAFRRRQFQ